MVARRSCVTGSSNRSSCIDGTSRIGLPAPDAAATAIMAGSSMTPDEILERVFLVAGATSTRSGTSRPGRSEDHPTLTRVPVAQPTASGVMIFFASSVIVTVMVAPCLLSSLASLTVSTAAIPPVTTR